jgi:anti-sigma B factor antagonist
MNLDLSTRRLGDRAVVSVGGEVDLETASQLSDAALDVVREGCPHLVVDLTDVTFMDSTGLKVLLAIHHRAQLAGGSLALAGASRTVLRVLTLTGLDQTFPLHDTVEDALAGAPASAAATSASGPAAEPTS